MYLQANSGLERVEVGKVLAMPKSVLTVMILFFSLIGVYLVSFNTFDLFMMRAGGDPGFALFPEVVMPGDPGMQRPGEDGQTRERHALFVQLVDKSLGEVFGRGQKGRFAQEPVHQRAGNIPVIRRLQVVVAEIQPIQRLGPTVLALSFQPSALKIPHRRREIYLAGKVMFLS